MASTGSRTVWRGALTPRVSRRIDRPAVSRETREHGPDAWNVGASFTWNAVPTPRSISLVSR